LGVLWYHNTQVFSPLSAHSAQEYRELFEGVGTGAGDKTLEDKFFEREVSLSFSVIGWRLLESTTPTGLRTFL
jgi:hypothetical protein